MAHAFKILIIDDDPSILETVTDLLEAAGYQTSRASAVRKV